MPLTKKEIEFLEDLEIRLQTQAQAKTKNIKDKLLVSHREFHKFWCILDNKEREVIERVKIHRNRLSRIAKEIHKSSKYVFTTRNRALKKMCEYIEEAEKDVKN